MSDLFLKFINLFFTAQIHCAVSMLFCGVESGNGSMKAWREYRAQSLLTPQTPLSFRERGRQWREKKQKIKGKTAAHPLSGQRREGRRAK
jgi:hypothetical protein